MAKLEFFLSAQLISSCTQKFWELEFVIEPEKEIFPRLVFTFLLVLDLLEIAIMVKFLNNYFQNKTDYVWLFL